MANFKSSLSHKINRVKGYFSLNAWLLKGLKLNPINRDFGYSRGKPLDRFYIENFVQSHKHLITGQVLEVGDRSYTSRFGSDKVEKSHVINPEDTSITDNFFYADLSNPQSLPSLVFDCFIATQTFSFIYDIHAAIQGSHKLLRPGGALICTLPGISQISRHDMDRWGDYWRLNSLSAKKIFGQIFGEANVKVQAFGNAKVAAGLLYGMSQSDLSRKELNHFDPDYEVIIGVLAIKQ